MTRYRLVAIAAAVLAAAACAGPGGTVAATSASAGPPASSGTTSLGASTSSGRAATGATIGVASTVRATGLPRPAHVVVVIEENHAYGDLIGSSNAPYISSLARSGASFTRSYAVSHPSEPNYLALFSGSTQGVTNDACPLTFSGANLGTQLRASGLTFAGFSQTMPRDGYLGCRYGAYARKHNPWSDFTSLPSSTNRTCTGFPGDYTTLPTVSFVVPDLDHDMHDGSVATGDTWLRDNLGGYVSWAATHNSLLVLTADEAEASHANHIATVIVGAHVRAGQYSEHVTHYGLLRTVEDMYGLGHLGLAAQATTISDVWR